MELPTLDKFPRGVLGKIDIQTAFMASRVIVAAERLQIFRALGGERASADAIGRKLGLHQRTLRVFLDVLVSLGLLGKKGDRYWNAPPARKYFIEERPIQWTRRFSAECVETYESFCDLERTLQTGKPAPVARGRKKSDYVASMKRSREEAEDFTQMLFYLHRDDAAALARFLDLRRYRSVLDVGGGSGVMSIALAKKNPHLRACVLDIAPVCRVAQTIIDGARLGRRVTTRPGDIRDPLPRGHDVVMFCDVGVVPKRLLRQAFSALPPGGLVVLVDRYLSEDRTEPLDRLLHHLLRTSFPAATHAEMAAAVGACGFVNVVARNVFEDVWFLMGFKPATTEREPGKARRRASAARATDTGGMLR